MGYIRDKVSVVIPTHNRGELITRAVMSALSQTYSNIEVIVVSDGSEDETDAVMRKIQESDPRINYISYHPGKGGNYARNIGIKAAQGEWVAFLDDDDEWHSDKLELQIKKAAEDSAVGLVCTAINSVQDAIGESSVFCPAPLYDSSTEILKRNCIGSTTTVLVRHNLLDECGMFDESLQAMQDYDLWIRLCQITKVAVVEKPCVEYHNLAGNNQISWNYEKYANAAKYLTRKYAQLRSAKLSRKENKEVESKSILSVARKAYKGGNRAKTREYAREALKIHFSLEGIAYIIASILPVKMVHTVFVKVKNG